MRLEARVPPPLFCAFSWDVLVKVGRFSRRLRGVCRQDLWLALTRLTPKEVSGSCISLQFFAYFGRSLAFPADSLQNFEDWDSRKVSRKGSRKASWKALRKVSWEALFFFPCVFGRFEMRACLMFCELGCERLSEELHYICYNMYIQWCIYVCVCIYIYICDISMLIYIYIHRSVISYIYIYIYIYIERIIFICYTPTTPCL